MNFPLEYPLFRWIYWLIDTVGVGGVTAALLGAGSTIAYLLTLRWIKNGAEAEESQTYTYPTAALLGHEHE